MRYSKRGQILAEVLEYINDDDWDRVDDFLIFGKAAYERFGEDMGADTRVENASRKLADKLKVNQGVIEVAKRISLAQIPKDNAVEFFVAFLHCLTEEDRENVQKALSEHSDASTFSLTSRDDPDAIDAALASNAVQSLEESLARVLTFDPIDLGRASIRNARYFDEAHLCDLAGMKIAAAVLCRAILESALIEKVDPKSDLNRPGASHIKLMIEKASSLHLDKERVIAAKRIQQAGNDAIHDLPGFNLKYARKMRDIIDDTRKVIIDLYKEDALQ